VAKDESVGLGGFRRRQQAFKACNLDEVEWELEHHFNREVHVRLRAGEGVLIMGKHVRGAVYALYRAVLDVKLFVAETLASAVTKEVIPMAFQDKMGRSAGGYVCLHLFRAEVPIHDSAVAQVLPQQDVQGSHHMSHHAVSDYDDLIEAAEDLANLFCREPAHVAAAGREWRSEADTSTARDCVKHVGTSCAQWRKGRV